MSDANEIPADVWAIVLGYTFSPETHYSPRNAPSIVYRVPLHCGLRLLCRTLTEGLDEWIRFEVDELGVKGGHGILRFVPRSTETTTRTSHKRTLLALSRAPREMLACVQTMPGAILTRRDVTGNLSKWVGPGTGIAVAGASRCFASICTFFSQLTHLSLIEGPCFSLQIVGPGLKQLDLSNTALTTVYNGFLADSNIEELLLPETLKAIENGFFRAATSRRIDLSQSYLESVGDEAFEGSKVEELLLPSTFKKARQRFLYGTNALKVLDLSGAALEDVGDFFLMGSGVERLILPPSLETIKSFGFLAKTTAKHMDLRRTNLCQVGFDFLHSSAATEVLFPSSLTSVAGSFWSRAIVGTGGPDCSTVEQLGPGPNPNSGLTASMSQPTPTKLSRIDLSYLQLVGTGSHFLERSRIDELLLPLQLQFLGDFFLSKANVKHIEWPSPLRHVGLNFLAESTVDQVVLPATFSTPGDKFLYCATVEVVDLSVAQVTDIADYFLEQVKGLETLLLPKSLITIGSRFLFQGDIRRVDLSSTSLKWVGASFLSHSSVEELVLPNTFRAAGSEFLYKAKKIRFLNLSQTQLVQVESEFMSESAVEEVVVPPSLNSIYLTRVWDHVTRLDFSRGALLKAYAEYCHHLHSSSSTPRTASPKQQRGNQRPRGLC